MCVCVCVRGCSLEARVITEIIFICRTEHTHGHIHVQTVIYTHTINMYIIYYIYVCVSVCVFYRQKRCILHVYAWHLEMVNDQCAALEFCSAPNFMSRRCSKKSCTTAVSIAEGLCSFSGNLIGIKDVWDKRIRATGKHADLSPKTALKTVRENWGNAPAAPKALWGFKFTYIFLRASFCHAISTRATQHLYVQQCATSA